MRKLFFMHPQFNMSLKTVSASQELLRQLVADTGPRLNHSETVSALIQASCESETSFGILVPIDVELKVELIKMSHQVSISPRLNYTRETVSPSHMAYYESETSFEIMVPIGVELKVASIKVSHQISISPRLNYSTNVPKLCLPLTGLL